MEKEITRKAGASKEQNIRECIKFYRKIILKTQKILFFMQQQITQMKSTNNSTHLNLNIKYLSNINYE